MCVCVLNTGNYNNYSLTILGKRSPYSIIYVHSTIITINIIYIYIYIIMHTFSALHIHTPVITLHSRPHTDAQLGVPDMSGYIYIYTLNRVCKQCVIQIWVKSNFSDDLVYYTCS